MNRIVVEQLSQKTTEEQEVEIVERKGLGHPDSICDAVMNQASVDLCQEYQSLFGRILHHNLDKAMLVAGLSRPALGGGYIEKPMRMIYGDRAVSTYQGKSIDVPGIVCRAAKKWIHKNLRFVDPDRHVLFESVLAPGSPELTFLFEHAAARANDTSAAVGFAPLTKTESTVLAVELHMNSPEFRRLFPEAGEDVKVMGIRRGADLHLTVAVAFVDRLIATRQQYFQRKDEIKEYLLRYISGLDVSFAKIKIDLNALDNPGNTSNGMYLTVLGTSAEGADSGEVGRGNRANGLISMTRPQTIEAHAGKNPVNHVGKIYSHFSNHVARQIYSRVQGVREVYVYICGQIGRPIREPMVSSAKLILDPGARLKDVQLSVASVMSEELARMNDFTKLLMTDDFYSQFYGVAAKLDV